MCVFAHPLVFPLVCLLYVAGFAKLDKSVCTVIAVVFFHKHSMLIIQSCFSPSAVHEKYSHLH